MDHTTACIVSALLYGSAGITAATAAIWKWIFLERLKAKDDRIRGLEEDAKRWKELSAPEQAKLVRILRDESEFLAQENAAFRRREEEGQELVEAAKQAVAEAEGDRAKYEAAVKAVRIAFEVGFFSGLSIGLREGADALLYQIGAAFEKVLSGGPTPSLFEMLLSLGGLNEKLSSGAALALKMEMPDLEFFKLAEVQRGKVRGLLKAGPRPARNSGAAGK